MTFEHQHELNRFINFKLKISRHYSFFCKSIWNILDLKRAVQQWKQNEMSFDHSHDKSTCKSSDTVIMGRKWKQKSRTAQKNSQVQSRSSCVARARPRNWNSIEILQQLWSTVAYVVSPPRSPCSVAIIRRGLWWIMNHSHRWQRLRPFCRVQCTPLCALNDSFMSTY